MKQRLFLLLGEQNRKYCKCIILNVQKYIFISHEHTQSFTEILKLMGENVEDEPSPFGTPPNMHSSQKLSLVQILYRSKIGVQAWEHCHSFQVYVGNF